MSRAVWKFPFEPPGLSSCTLSMPRGAEIHSAQMQGSVICLWASVAVDAPKVARKFVVVGTGHTLPNRLLRFISTILMSDGNIVIHVFEDISEGGR